jgi:hypothetical protein
VAERLPLIEILREPPARTPDPGRRGEVDWTAVARRLESSAATGAATAVERCEMCGVAVDPGHGHVVDRHQRSILCVCRPCHLLFGANPAGRFVAVPGRYLVLNDFEQVGERWDALRLPIGLAFVTLAGTPPRPAAFFPSPAGATETEIDGEAWDSLVEAMPVLDDLAPDVEALLVRREDGLTPGGSASTGRTAFEAVVAPIDACYELVGRIRAAWTGLQGGDEVWREVGDFFVRARRLADRSAP